MTLQSTKLETTISAMKDYKQLNYILSELNALRLCLGVPTRHTTLAKLLDDAIEESAGLVASAQDYVDQNR
jgi:hypothetical protein